MFDGLLLSSSCWSCVVCQCRNDDGVVIVICSLLYFVAGMLKFVSDVGVYVVVGCIVVFSLLVDAVDRRFYFVGGDVT